MAELKINFKYFYDICGKDSSADKVLNFCRAASVLGDMRSVRIGQMGYMDMQLYGTQFDGISLKREIGAEIESFEMLEMVQRAQKQSDEDIEEVKKRIYTGWEFLKKPDKTAIEKTALYYLALEQITEERKYDAISLKDVDGFKKLLGFPPAPVFTMLAEDGICTIPENDCLGNVTQVLIKKLTGQIGAYLEFYEFFEDGVLAGVPDYIPREVTDGKVKIMPAAFGELSQGLLNVSKVKTGELTMARLAFSEGRYVMHVVKGEGITPQKWEECGWDQPAPQLPGLKIILSDIEDFAQKVMGQHYIISYGDNTQIIKEFCSLCGIKTL